MSLVRAATSANDLRSGHAITGIVDASKMILSERRSKTGPAGTTSNFATALNNGSPHRRQVYSPGRFSSRKIPQNGSSSPSLNRSSRSSSLRSAASSRICSCVGGSNRTGVCQALYISLLRLNRTAPCGTVRLLKVQRSDRNAVQRSLESSIGSSQAEVTALLDLVVVNQIGVRLFYPTTRRLVELVRECRRRLEPRHPWDSHNKRRPNRVCLRSAV